LIKIAKNQFRSTNRINFINSTIIQGAFFENIIILKVTFWSRVTRCALIAIEDPQSLMNEEFTKWWIEFFSIWRLSFFLENFHCITVLIFCKKIWNHHWNLWLWWKFYDFYPLQHSTKIITWSYIQEIRLAQIVLLFLNIT
jgi:hypothetical protein